VEMRCTSRAFALAALCAVFSLWAIASGPMNLWPGEPPGPKATTNPEVNTTKPSDHLTGGKTVIRLGNITVPTSTFYPAPARTNTGAAVVVFPGGGYRILAWDLEGTEICEWLNSIGVNAVLVKYRVPEPNGIPRYQEPLADAQRAIGVTRLHASEWKIDPNRVGVIGFSAGGDLAALVSNTFENRTYTPVDQADSQSCRPDFVMLIYPAYLVPQVDSEQLAPELHVSAETPPTFLVQTEDDPIHVENSLFYYVALKRAKVPAEMHLYSKGGHGYGLRHTDLEVTTWPTLATEWLRSRGVLNRGAH
ncbi:MAG: alpha/beta hydrolase, partial [Bryobacteraceae bacterium]